MGAPGDFAQAYVVAHEVGHHVQNLMGITGKVDACAAACRRTQANALSVRVELQADCLAGVWAHHSQKGKGWLERGDLEEALNAAAQIGDDTLQRQLAGHASCPRASRTAAARSACAGSSAACSGGSVNQCNPELRRARELRPVVAAADHILDLHSTSSDVQPFWVYPHFERNGRAAMAIGLPRVHLVMPAGLGSGTPVIQHGRHGEDDHHGVALVAECGQHFKRASGELAKRVAWRFLAHFGLVEGDEAGAPEDAREGDDAGDAGQATASPPRRYALLRTHVIKNESFAFTRPLVGFETFAEGDLIATDGDEEIRAPCDDCTVMMPARRAIVGREGVYLTRPLP
jgi:hypothetical protein